MTPIGIVIGLSVSKVSPLLTVVFFGIAAGTFIYVACTEIITEEFEVKRLNGVKLLCTLAGGAVITALWYLHRE